MESVGFRISDINETERFCSRIYISIDGKDYTLRNQCGKLEIIGDSALELSMGGGCNLIYIDSNKGE